MWNGYEIPEAEDEEYIYVTENGRVYHTNRECTHIRLSVRAVSYTHLYSPVHRCLQSSFALTLGQLLSEKHPTLYLNFEHYIGISELRCV